MSQWTGARRILVDQDRDWVRPNGPHTSHGPEPGVSQWARTGPTPTDQPETTEPGNADGSRLSPMDPEATEQAGHSGPGRLRWAGPGGCAGPRQSHPGPLTYS